MSKLKNPLLSLGAHGSIGRVVTFQTLSDLKILRKKPIPTDPLTLSQQYQRWDYQLYLDEWCSLSEADKQSWKSKAASYHMPGLAFFLKNRLTLLPDIVARYHMDTTVSNSFPDTSRNANPAVCYGALPAPGVIDHAYSYDGQDDYAQAPHIVAHDCNQWSLFCFCYPLSPTTYEEDLGGVTDNSGYDLLFYINPARHFNCGFYDTLGAWHAVGSFSDVIQETWQSYCSTFDGQYIRGYHNAVLKATSADFSAFTPRHLGRPIRISRSTTGGQFHGLIDEWILFNRAIPLSTIQLLHARTYPLK